MAGVVTVLAVVSCGNRGSSGGEGRTACAPTCAPDACGVSDGCGGTCGPPGCGSTRACAPSCDGKACGDDGCGGSCGACAGEQSCRGGHCECVPRCSAGSCGAPDGCGGTCGCARSEACVNGQCVCAASCDGRTCGPDGCGGSCGSCAPGESCREGQCVCTPDCAPGDCETSDGCGGVCGCGPGQACADHHCACAPSCGPDSCGPDGCGGTCGSCGANQACVDDHCVCAPSCGANTCGSDGCGGSCGTCPAGQSCSAGHCVCTPACPPGSCGSDGCGGSCGSCGASQACVNDRCVCAPSCGDHTCGSDGCGGSCGSCAAGQSCSGGHCVCTPSCAPGGCGDDGCGGSCGSCAPGQSCRSGQCVCTPHCATGACGDDGCGGSCGTCGAGQTCQAGRCSAGCAASWSPEWTIDAVSGPFWVELHAAGGGALTTAVTIENVATRARYPLRYAVGRWAGGVVLPSGTLVVLRATSALGATAKTLPFRYLQAPAPHTDPCGGTAPTNTSCPPLSRGLVTFTLDDSGASQPTIAIPLMQRYGVKGTFFVVPAWHTWTSLARTLAANGHEFGDHSMTHATLTQLTPQQLEDELRLSQQWIQSNIGGPVDSFASPSGAWNADVIAAARRHFGSHRTTDSDLNFVGTDVYKLTTELVLNTSTAQGLCAKMQEAARQKGWLILTFHDFTRASSSTDGFTVPAAVFEAILACATRTPGLDVVTSRQGAAAIRCGSPP